MKIAIPSKSRPFISKSKELLKSAVLFVPESEIKDYSKIYEGCIGVPDKVRGITKTRNWILDFWKGEDVVFVDDDLLKCGYWVNKYTPSNGQRIFKKINDERVIINEFEKIFEICRELGYKIWGLKTESSKISQHDEKPFLFMTYITASCMGIIDDGEFKFDETFKVKEDYEIGLRHVVKKGGVLGVRYFSWENKHWDKNGGCGDYRTNDMELDAINKLLDLYPQFVKKVKTKNSVYGIKLYF